jgi:hypothetical protein
MRMSRSCMCVQLRCRCLRCRAQQHWFVHGCLRAIVVCAWRYVLRSHQRVAAGPLLARPVLLLTTSLQFAKTIRQAALPGCNAHPPCDVVHSCVAAGFGVSCVPLDSRRPHTPDWAAAAVSKPILPWPGYLPRCSDSIVLCCLPKSAGAAPGTLQELNLSLSSATATSLLELQYA